MCFSSSPPAAAPIVQAIPEAPVRTTRRTTSERVKQSTADERKRLAALKGDKSTIHTSPLGLTEDENIGTKSLLA